MPKPGLLICTRHPERMNNGKSCGKKFGNFTLLKIYKYHNSTYGHIMVVDNDNETRFSKYWKKWFKIIKEAE